MAMAEVLQEIFYWNGTTNTFLLNDMTYMAIVSPARMLLAPCSLLRLSTKHGGREGRRSRWRSCSLARPRVAPRAPAPQPRVAPPAAAAAPTER
jgi:hypothetical protein